MLQGVFHEGMVLDCWLSHGLAVNYFGLQHHALQLPFRRFGEDVNVFDLKSILLCLSMFFSISTICMLVSILATATLFIREHPFMVTSKVQEPTTQFGFIERIIVVMADPSARYGVNPTKTYWNWLWAIKSA